MAEQQHQEIVASCSLCKHWNMDAARAIIRQLSQDKEGMLLLNRWRHTFTQMADNPNILYAHEAEDGEGVDVEHALASLGICELLSTLSNAPVMMHPQDFCPDEIPDTAIPFGIHFEARNPGKWGQGGSFDQIMRKALGEE